MAETSIDLGGGGMRGCGRKERRYYAEYCEMHQVSAGGRGKKVDCAKRITPKRFFPPMNQPAFAFLFDRLAI